MFEWWNALSTVQQVFYVIAIPSTLILLIQTILLLFGIGQGGGESDMGTDSDADGDYDTSADSGAEHVEGLRVLTVRGIVSFLAMSGWVGVAMSESDAHIAVTILVSLLAGAAAMFLVALFFRFAMKMQQSGNLDLKNAVGLIGEVYLTIPADGKGKVTLVVQGRFMELDAISTGSSIKTGQRVKVTEVTDSNILIVDPLS